MWPTYRTWYLQDGGSERPDLATCRRALEQHMPELVPVHERLAELAGGDELAARLLSLYRPPGFVVGCSQGAWTRAGGPVLVRNYDYPVERLEGIVYLTQWGERRVIGMSDCLWGLLDGINDSGLAISLTFGGRRDVGDGFAIPLVVRYVLETCDTVAEARAALARIPVHAPQNLTLLDRSGEYLTAYVGPDRPAEFRDVAATTNHQGKVEWPEYAAAIRTVEREQCVLGLLGDDGDDARALRRVVPRAAAAQHRLRAGLRDDLHGRVLPRRGARRVPLAGHRVGAVVRPLRAVGPHAGVRGGAARRLAFTRPRARRPRARRAGAAAPAPRAGGPAAGAGRGRRAVSAAVASPPPAKP